MITQEIIDMKKYIAVFSSMKECEKIKHIMNKDDIDEYYGRKPKDYNTKYYYCDRYKDRYFLGSNYRYK